MLDYFIFYKLQNNTLFVGNVTSAYFTKLSLFIDENPTYGISIFFSVF